MKIHQVLEMLSLNKIKKIKRSELLLISEYLDFFDPNDYISQLVRENPDLEIINDLK